jgi:hypothetical protein
MQMSSKTKDPTSPSSKPKDKAKTVPDPAVTPAESNPMEGGRRGSTDGKFQGDHRPSR